MKKYIVPIICLAFFSCSEKDKSDKLVVQAEIKNAGTGKAYLEEIYFVQKPPLIVDTADIKDGKFELETNATEEGFYRIRLENGRQFFFINDEKKIKIEGNASDSTMLNDKVNTRANVLLYKFLGWMEPTGKEIDQMNNQLRGMLATAPDDSATAAFQQQMIEKMKSSVTNLQQYTDTVSDPVVAMFALGNLSNADQTRTTQSLASLRKRFPEHKALSELEEEIKKKQSITDNMSAGKPKIGDMAPDLTMNDTEGNSFSISSLKGKYVLVDFWASWCAPCRDENPNVVAAFNKFKNKNFTVLGVSLDQDKAAWLKAIKDDGLAWKHISDLKYWNSDAVSIYKVDGIPYNVLVDPSGKIIATGLQGAALDETLASVLK